LWDAWNSDVQAVKIGIEIVPKIIEESGGVVAREFLRDKIEGKGLSRRTAYRRIEEAEKLKLIKFQKGKDAYELY
jgi:hypothetical protein